MWLKLSRTIIRNRLLFIFIIVGLTAFMGWKSRSVEWSFVFESSVPSNDPDRIFYENFKKEFGEDSGFMGIGVLDSSLYKASNFKLFEKLSYDLEKVHGVTNVISIAKLQKLQKDTANRKFQNVPLTDEISNTQKGVDEYLEKAKAQKFFSQRILNFKNGATFIIVALDPLVFNSEQRQDLVNKVTALGNEFEKATRIKMYYAGLPFVRATLSTDIKRELNLFMGLSILVTSLIMFIFFRSWVAVVFPLAIIAVIVIWVMGSLALFGYKITLMSGLIPPIIVVIGIPNSIYLLNKYHQEYIKHQKKIFAISRVIQKIGVVTMITNLTTAIGFLVLILAKIPILREFGTIAGLNIMATFIVSIIVLPVMFSYLPAPTSSQLNHLHFRPLDFILKFLDDLVHNKRWFIYLNAVLTFVITCIGVWKLEAVSYIVDDIPDDNYVKVDMKFFEKQFDGILPLEISVDTGKKRGIINLKNLRKIEKFERFLDSLPYISKPVSIVEFVKASKMAYYNNNPKYYQLPNNQERTFLLRYLKNQSNESKFFKSFVDSTAQKMRIVSQVADIGSNKMDSLVSQVVEPRMKKIFEGSKIKAKLTGQTPLFIKGNSFLIKSLRNSLILAFFIIAIIMGILFKNLKIIMICIIPNVIPLIVTAGLMGYFGIPLKISTALIFSIAFGISVDDSIHFLTKYRQELLENNFYVPIAISNSLRETGASMLYTSIILFFGFIIFAFSSFHGTQALGILTSTTLLFAMITNLTLLPALLLSFDKGKDQNFKSFVDPEPREENQKDD